MLPELTPDRLLAKSVEGKWKGSYSLVGHTADVARAVTILIDVLGDRLINQFDLGCDFSYLRSTARLAAYLHDWGKANDHFQGVVRSRMPNASPKRNPMQNPQLIRHEIVSILLAWEFRAWLKEGEGDFMTALAAAGGHHLKLGGKNGKDTSEIGEIRPCGDDKVHLYLFHPDFKQLLRFGIKQVGCPETIKLAQKPTTEWTVTQIKRRREALLTLDEDCFANWQPHEVLLAVVKALLVTGDAIASAFPQTNLNLKAWIQDALKENILTATNLQSVMNARLQSNLLRQFQIDLGNIKTRVGLARAGCGTGKTVGAYNWAKRHAVGRKLFFCYPTTGTSTEGFLDYVQEELKSTLLHSRAEIDLELAKLELAKTGEETEVGDVTVNEAALKLDSFKAWDKQAIVCTVDTVLGLMQCNRRPMYCFPAIANAAFVFDEVHCYDDALFGALLRFLKTLKAPVLLMSASFLPSQLEEIKKAVGEDIEIVFGPKDLELQPRYRFHYDEKPDWQRVEQELAAGGKVLWICNQVGTAVGMFEAAQERGINALLYHSRFKYKDRLEHHRSVINAFKPDRFEPVLAIATQVAEMSLDLSATLMVSQIADPAALIQRLGRLNRNYCGHALDALFYEDTKKHPYSNQQRDRGLAMVQAFRGEVNQAQLADWLERDEVPVKPKTESVLLDGQWRTYPAPLREGGVTVTCLLAQDEPKFKNLSQSELNLYTVPLVVDPKQVSQWERYKNFPIAPSDQWGYCPKKGAYATKRGETP